MQNERREHPPGRLFRRFFDLDLATKFSLMFSCMILAVLFLTALVMSRSGLRYVMEEQDARCLLSLDYVRILIEKDQSYVDGLTEYYISSAEAQQGGQGGTRPFERLMSSYSSMEWEYIPAYSDVFMEMDHSPKLVLWKKLEDYNTQRTIGAVAVSVDVRKLLGADPDVNPAQNTVLLSQGGEVALNRTGLELPEELIARICAEAADTPGIYPLELGGERYNIYSQVCEGTPFISCVIEPDSASFGARPPSSAPHFSSSACFS